MKDSWERIGLLSLVLLWTTSCLPAMAHDHTRKSFFRTQQRRLARAQVLQTAASKEASCQLKVQLVDADTGRPVAGLLRITDLSRNQPIDLPELIQREGDWYAAGAKAEIKVPQVQLKLEVLHGITTKKFERVLELQGLDQRTVKVSLKRFYNPSKQGLVSGNTHLHLMRLTHAEAHRYLRIVPQADNLDLVFLSHLRRLPDERHYISNQFTEADLQRLSQGEVLFGNGEEHRHNFGRGGEGYGHVMLLDLIKLIRPVSIGPGIMGTGTDGLPLQRGIRQARSDGATVIWCHNSLGFEDIPNWMGGLVDAQNIFDGGSQGSYTDSFYRYLNLGLRVPFSTGTDWFIYDFSRVYAPVQGKLTVKKWLRSLADGRSYITNGPMFEFRMGESQIGDTIERSQPGSVKVTGRVLGRSDFGKLELIHNGRVIHAQRAAPQEGHYQAAFELSTNVDQSGWFALRTTGGNAKNAFGRPIFGHTSPIYVELAGKPVFDPKIAQQLIQEIKQGVEVIESKGTFADQQERAAVMKVYEEGIRLLQQRLKDHAARK